MSGQTPTGDKAADTGFQVWEAPAPLERSVYPVVGAGLQFVIKPRERMNVNLEYSQGIEDNRGVYLKLGYAW